MTSQVVYVSCSNAQTLALEQCITRSFVFGVAVFLICQVITNILQRFYLQAIRNPIELTVSGQNQSYQYELLARDGNRPIVEDGFEENDTYEDRLSPAVFDILHKFLARPRISLFSVCKV